MTLTAQIQIKPKVKAYGIVRDVNGRPKVDDINALAPEHIAAMTDEDLDYLGIKKEKS